MKCPKKNTFQDPNQDMPEEYSEWNLHCQECKYFEECTMTLYDNLTKGDKDKAEHSSHLGDNFPNYPDIKLRILLHQERCDIIEKALLKGLGRISKDDITDFQIDIGLYNKSCRKDKIKRQYKKKDK